jgi:hypothetical protein
VRRRLGAAADRLLALPALPLLALLFAVALLHRAPAMLFHDLNLDEGLYRLIGTDLAAGTAPYLAFWDRKPVGTFLLIAGLETIAGGSLAAFRIATALAVGLAAWLLALAVRRLAPGLPRAALPAALLHILFSVQNGGFGMNTELFFTPASLGALVLALDALGRQGRAADWRALGAGLLFGAAIQIKPFAIFDGLAWLGLLLIARQGMAAPPGLRALALPLAAGLLGTLLPSLLVLGWYAAIGELGTWVEANIAGNLGLVGGAAPGFNLPGLVAGLRGFGPLTLAAAATLGLAPFLLRGAAEWRAAAGLGWWLLCMALMLAFGRRFADHFFLQLLPALAFAAGLGLALGWRAAEGLAPRLRPLGGVAVLLLALALGARLAAGGQLLAGEVLWRRHLAGLPHWGDTTATLAAAIGDRIAGPGDLHVVGRWLDLHRLTGTRPPTRFPFALHLVAGYAPVDGPAELARILAAAPRFVVVETGWRETRPGRGAREAAVFAVLEAALARDYRPDGTVAPFIGWRGGLVAGSAHATVYRRRDVPPPAPGPGLAYRAAE